jgi:hypothetical protein
MSQRIISSESVLIDVIENLLRANLTSFQANATTREEIATRTVCKAEALDSKESIMTLSCAHLSLGINLSAISTNRRAQFRYIRGSQALFFAVGRL